MRLSEDDKNWLTTRFEGSIKFDEPMSKHTSLRVGGPVEVFAIPDTLEELMVLVEWAWKKEIPYLTVGGGTNLLVTDNGVHGIILLLTHCLNKITSSGKDNGREWVTAAAGVKLAAFCRYAIENGLSGTNFALGIPGTIGGAIMMNAGTVLGSMTDILETVTVYQPERGMHKLGKAHLDFGYRSLSLEKVCNPSHGLPIVLEGCFRLHREDPYRLQQEGHGILLERREREPNRYPSAGSFFKNPESGKTAGELIDSAGLKGRQIGGAEISSKHANYIVNRKNATAGDILSLMKLIQETVLERFGISLEPEVKIIGD
ncbi:MAG TPA: UDP-N-acetylmuramate dehydrogenase [Deltaproteobacteria bacterium]|nr:UDP-N-acetylmuramate dehydrogenase [Deltaproteobacteria bacterium]